MNKGNEKALDVFHNRCLRKTLRFRWKDHVSTKELLERAAECGNEVSQMKIIGHILRKDRNDDCNVAMSWAPEGKRRRGKPKATWRPTVGKEREEAG